MNNDKIFQLNSVKTKYAKQWDNLFTFISEKQIKDDIIWQLLIRQYTNKTDDVDEGWRGEYWGKLMRGGALIYSYSKDKELYSILTQAVEGMLLEQEENGRFSSYSQQCEFKGWDMWSRKYVMLGMEYFYDVCEDEVLKNKILIAMQSHADYIMNHVGNGENKIPVRKTSDHHLGYNSFSILQPFVKLYSLTKQEKYLAYAKEMVDSEFEENGLFALAYANEKNPYEYPVTKAYEMMSCFEGLLEYYEVTGEDRFLTASKLFADRILENDFVIIGACGSHDEYFNNSTKTQVLKTEVNKFETCVTVTLMKYIATLYRYTGEKKYLDAIEKSFYNAYLGALIDVENVWGMAVPLFYSYSPVYQNERWTLMGGGKNISSYARFGCCVAIGAAGLGVIPTIGVCERDDDIFIGLYIAGEYQLSNAKIRIDTEYPYDGKVKITLLESRDKQNLKLRIPGWCEKFIVDREFSENNGFISVECAQGESVEYVMEMPYKVRSSKLVNDEVKELFAITVGPIVLCADSCETDIYQSYQPDEINGYAIGSCESGAYKIKMKDGKILTLREYCKTGKNYHTPREISVWLNKQ